jgi:NAD(P)-dependent dehydrogenase (short-subunit alcohol dehydrogenase family)
MIANAPARVINVASQTISDTRQIKLRSRPRPVALDLDDLQAEHDFKPMHAYARAKLAMVMCGYQLARQLDGTGVTVNALHPGLVATGTDPADDQLVAHGRRVPATGSSTLSRLKAITRQRTIPTLGDRRASGHSIIGLAVFDRAALRAEAIGRCWSRGRLLAWLSGVGP